MTAKPPRSAPPHASSSPFADCLAVDQRRLRSLARDLRHLFGGKREALSAEHDRLLGQSRAAVAARRARLPHRSLPTICRSTCAARKLRR
jgi:hypothetical protein